MSTNSYPKTASPRTTGRRVTTDRMRPRHPCGFTFPTPGTLCIANAAAQADDAIHRLFAACSQDLRALCRTPCAHRLCVFIFRL
jgi:hypothetical protein